jgi:hypothetical protein
MISFFLLVRYRSHINLTIVISDIQKVEMRIVALTCDYEFRSSVYFPSSGLFLFKVFYIKMNLIQ